MRQNLIDFFAFAACKICNFYFLLFQSKFTTFSTKLEQKIMKNQDLAEIETPEAETWHAYVLFDAEQEYINDKSKFCRCLLCFFKNFVPPRSRPCAATTKHSPTTIEKTSTVRSKVLKPRSPDE